MQRHLLTVITFTLILTIGFINPLICFALKEEESEIFIQMLERAEAIVNYEWIPNQNMDVWNENPYNGKMYFEGGKTVIGMPYTLFSYELGFDSLLSFSQFKFKENQNYSTTAYCSSVGDTRTGPVYGSCCATFVSEVLGGSFMNEGNPRYDYVTGIQNSPYGTTYRNVTIDNLKPGDAISNTVSSHIMWVGAIDDTTLTIYEQTPPVARKVVVDKASAVDANGYFVYGGKIYNIVTKSNDLIGTMDDSFALSNKYPLPINAYTISTGKTFVYDSINGNKKANKIYHTDLCRITKVYENGWCYVYFPLDVGGSDSGYVKINEFFDFGSDLRLAQTKMKIIAFSRDSLSNQMNEIVRDNSDIYILNEADTTVQILYPIAGNEYALGWISSEQLQNIIFANIHGDINYDGIVKNKDLTRLMKHLAGETVVVQEPVLDINGDGNVNNKDLTRLMKFLAGEDIEI